MIRYPCLQKGSWMSTYLIWTSHCVETLLYIDFTKQERSYERESRLLGYKTRNEEVMRARAVILLSSERRAANGKVKQERSYSSASLTCLEIRSRNEEAISSTRNKIYSPKVFHFLLYWRLRRLLVWIRVLATTGNTSAVAGYTRVYCK